MNKIKEKHIAADPNIICSVIIPCFNQANFLEECIGCVLQQTYQHFEIIVINDGSSNSRDIDILDNLNYPKTRIINQINLGVSNARNSGIRAANGQFILALDADDKIDSSYLEKTIGAFSNSESLGIVYSKARMFGESEKSWELPKYSFPGILLGNQIFSAAVFKKALWQKSRGFDESLGGWEDFDFWLQLIENGAKVHRIEEELFFYRRHANSATAKYNLDKEANLFSAIVARHQGLYLANMAFIYKELANLREMTLSAMSNCNNLSIEVETIRTYAQKLEDHVISLDSGI